MTSGFSATKANALRTCRLLAALTLVLLPASASWASDAFARVGDQVISYEDFENEVVMAARQTYYHGRPSSEEAFKQFRQSVAEDLVNRYLLLREAGRRGVEPESGTINERLKVYEDRYAATERWQREGAQMLASLRQRFEQDSIIEKFERDVRATRTPTDQELREFYTSNPDKFTEPQQHRLSVIVLSVEPSATPPVWAAARAEAARIIERIRLGSDFSELAGLHSSDVSARQGGDMGYLHEGMLSPAAETAVGSLTVGELSEPVTVLEGVAIFLLTDRRPEKLRPYAEVAARAAELWARSVSDLQWESKIAELRGADDVFVDATYLASTPRTR